LQKAIGLGNFSKAFQIIQYLNTNAKEHPLVLTLANLHNYFQKLLLIKGIGSDQKVLGISPFFFK
jgi:DNA polymerase-3 subunit delta